MKAKPKKKIHAARPPTEPPSRSENKQLGLIAVILFVVACAAFYPATQNGFIDYDDNDYVTANYHVQNGLNRSSLAWAFTNTDAANWHPLTWITHILDCQIYGPNPWGHHLTSVVIHSCNVVLVFFVLRAMGGAKWLGVAGALLFGLHPLRVESVAWIAERKDVLSMLFWLFTLWAYLSYASGCRKNGRHFAVHYILALVFFILGLMSKPMVVTLPFILLLLDFWPLNRLNRTEITRVWVEKIPFFAIAGVGSLVAFAAQKNQGAITSYLTFPQRVETGVIAYVRYVGKFFWPSHLAVLYPHPVQWPAWEVGAALGCLGLIFWFAIKKRREHPYLLMGWLWYFITLIPVIGLVQIGSQSLADRYTYVPEIGLLIMVLWSANSFIAGDRRRAQPLLATAGVISVCFFVLTERQIAFWKDSGSIFAHAVAVTDNNFIANKALADYEASHQETGQAIAHYRAALQIAPDYTSAHLNLGALLNNLGQHDEAVKEFEEVARLEPANPQAYNNLAAILGEGHLDQSIALFEKAVSLAPTYLDARKNLGQAYDHKGRLPDAIAQYEAALRIQPDADAEYFLAVDLEKSGRHDEAMRHLKISAAARPQPNRASEALDQIQRLKR